ncbi:MAG: hypothetical protein Q8M29_04940 [Bacteroidota bacterium]|nr:hypothetical protein [Bacteroidota bacterium]
MSAADKDTIRTKRIVIKSYNLTQLAEIYGMTLYRMRRALHPLKVRLGKKEGYFYTTKQVTLILRFVKLPSNIEVVKA